MPAGVSQTAVVEGRAVRARNFPAAWVQPSTISALPQKAQVLLQRIGEIAGTPAAVTGPHGPEVIANFKSATSAREAVKRLHGTDLRTDAEKKAVDYRPAKEHERFWLQPVEPGSVTAAAAASSTPRGPKSSKPKKRTIPNGLILTPLPPSWAEKDVMILVQPYGQVLSVRMETLASGQRGAYIEFSKETVARSAQQQLDGLSLLGKPLQCVFQEETEPPKPPQMHIIFIDELAMPSRPEVEPRLDDRELFVTDLPPPCRDVESARIWLSGFQAGVEEVLVLRDEKQVATGKAYARFRTHKEAVQTLSAIDALSYDGTKKVSWSESERVQQRRQSPYGVDVLSSIAGRDNAALATVAEKAGAMDLRLEVPSGIGGSSASSATGLAGKVHFVVTCEEPEQVEECKQLLVVELAKAHEAYIRDVRGSLVVRGFPPSWTEQSLKAIFASYGGIVSSTLLRAELGVAGSEAVAYVRLRNAMAMDKAVTNLNQTKVGDGDIVEECVVKCSRQRIRAWSNGDFYVSFFIDQLHLSHRPTSNPGPEDRELFVKNLPLQDMNRQQLQDYFEGFGQVEDLHLISDPFTNEDTSEGYVRFRLHSDAARCIEALSPAQGGPDADTSELCGQWSESERALQRKSSCYAFSLIVDLVGADGENLKSLKEECKVKDLWVMAESLTQKDREAPAPSGKQLHVVARCSDQSQVQLLRQCLERALGSMHQRIVKRERRKRRKAEDAAAGIQRPKKAAGGGKDVPGPPASAPPAPGATPPPGAVWPPTNGQAAPPAPHSAPGAGGGWHPPPHAPWVPPPGAPPGYYWPPPPGHPAGAPPGGKGGDRGQPPPFDPYRAYGHGPPPRAPPPGHMACGGHPPPGVHDGGRERSRGRRRGRHENGGGEGHRDGHHRHHRRRRGDGGD